MLEKVLRFFIVFKSHNIVPIGWNPQGNQAEEVVRGRNMQLKIKIDFKVLGT